MKGITQNEFLQGVAFTHKFYEQQYKYGKSNEYGTYLVKQGALMETLDIHTITETGFTVNELFFDTLIDVVVLFADCKIVENQPQTTKEQHNETTNTIK